jgi:hypothetical protein
LSNLRMIQLMSCTVNTKRLDKDALRRLDNLRYIARRSS